MKPRNCQPCTACCEGWLASKNIDMTIGHPCKHCSNGGCDIYDKRPVDPCRTFRCAWVEEGSALCKTLRPDRCGAILLNNRKFKQWDVLIATPTGWKIPDRTLQEIMDFAFQQNMPLIYIENLHKNGVYTHFSRSGFGPAPFLKVITGSTRQIDFRQI